MNSKPDSPKTAPYRVFREKAGSAALVIQVREPETGEAVHPCDLEAYRARVKIAVPWNEVAIPPASKLLLTPKAARFLLAAGSITTMEEPGLIILRGKRAKAGRPTPAGDQADARKAEPAAARQR